ncbi:MAG: hypothetical protein AM326_06895 [Candidatus Thorarchaeota archaeon SMTZ-45]|nr:MAG: hypothetical protein AM325_05095 [Candidatus Thorarchaeota archaeon SMTZ1-45]KXH76643.1 MAG: hypothetical protein AM326_06895 [Candidatus Thorarchaeota archaeon SMTZ-45]
MTSSLTNEELTLEARKLRRRLACVTGLLVVLAILYFFTDLIGLIVIISSNQITIIALIVTMVMVAFVAILILLNHFFVNVHEQ